MRNLRRGFSASDGVLNGLDRDVAGHGEVHVPDAVSVVFQDSRLLPWKRILTVRRLIGKVGGGRGHRTFTGTPVRVADTVRHYFENGAADGFNIMPAVLPSGIEAFAGKVVPILQERGPFRTEYEGTTLRALRAAATGQPAGPDRRGSTPVSIPPADDVSPACSGAPPVSGVGGVGAHAVHQ